tara:strand:- start:1110 stop:2531 length:1422 start_codon:yes stop_codon:yes gene_type:complete
MSLQVYQQPSDFFHPAYANEETLFVVGETSSTVYNYNNFKFIFEVFAGFEDILGNTVTEFHKFSVKPNSAGYAYFDVANVVQDYCTTDTEIYAVNGSTSTFDGTTPNTLNAQQRYPIHIVDELSKQYSNMIRVAVVVYENYTIGSSNFAGQNYTLIGTYNFFNGCLSQDTGGDFFNDSFYACKDANGRFWSDFLPSITRKVRSVDYHTIAFPNGEFRKSNNSTQTSNIFKLKFEFFNSAGVSQGTHTLLNNSATGGALPQGVSYSDADDIAEGLLYAGVGPKNLTNSGASIPAATSYYTVRGQSATSTNTTALYTFELQDNDCKGFETIRLAFLNKLGAWDYYNFTKKSIKTVNTERGLMKQNEVNQQYLYAQRSSFEGGSQVYRSNSVQVIEANTDYITEEEARALESLFTSPQVYLQDLVGDVDAVVFSAPKFYPVVVTEKTYQRQTTANDGLKQYVIQIEKSNNIPRQRL